MALGVLWVSPPLAESQNGSQVKEVKECSGEKAIWLAR